MGIALGVAMLIGAGVANAQSRGDDGAKVGVGMICDSQAQAARFLELRATGKSADQAMAAVNREAHNAKACGLAAIAFTQDAMVDSKSVDNQLVHVVRIRILAGYTGATWQPMKDFVQYAILEPEGLEV
ncbi:MAG TPA: hypothetical protein VNR39_14180 [Pseudolabrys sp.]|nr:hypothetical protein [Pseudolabrys sp.]